MARLEGKKALITGGSEGIGYATAKKFLEEGAALVIITGRDQAKLDNATSELSAFGAEKVMAIQSDAANEEAINALFASIGKNEIKLDILFLNAGTAERNTIGDTTFAFYQNLFNVNTIGPMYAVDKSKDHLAPGASIIFNISAAGSMAIPMLSAYCATKGAIVSYMKSAALELAPQGIRVNAVSPGNTDTPLGRQNNAGHMDEAAANVPLEGVFSHADEIADSVVFLASDESRGTTGLDLIADRGLSLGPPPANSRKRAREGIPAATSAAP